MKRNVKAHLIAAAVTLVFGGLYYYFSLPVLNIHSTDPLIFIALLTLVYAGVHALGNGWRFNPVTQVSGARVHIPRPHSKKAWVVTIVLGVCILTGVIGSITGMEIFNASRYRKLLSVEEGDFTTDVSQITFDDIPRLDRDSAQKLGDRKMGELSDMVSQFSVMNDYSQINYQGRPVRVTPLAYADIFKWFSNVKSGVPGYLMIDMVTQEVELVRLPEGMKYSTAEHFNRKLERHLRFNYPTKIFADPNFEVDEEGTPYWICPTYKFRVGLYGGRDIEGAVLVNAVTGDCQYYPVDKIPNWVDRVYNAELIIEQYDYYGMLVNGFWNSVFAQKDCRVTTDGYNYLALGDDVYMYTGVTSVAADQSNIGFILSNQRTKETHFYPVAGATEYSAMDSAEGQVQEKRYSATFPLLLNISGEPTYFIALKDASQLVKMYAMVNVGQYQIVSTAATVEQCEAEYIKRMNADGITAETPPDTGGSKEVTGAITEIRTAVVGGNTCYYFRLEGAEKTFALSVATDERAVILNVGDTVTFTYTETDGPIQTVTGMK